MRFRGLSFLLLLGVGLSTLACDPGWDYEIPNATRDEDGLIPMSSPPAVGFRVAGSLFATTLWVYLEVTNEGKETVSIEMANATLSDAVSNPIAIDRWEVDAPCDDRDKDGLVRVKVEERCLFTAVATVIPLVGRGLGGGKPNPDLINLTLVHDGISRWEQSIPLTVQLRWALTESDSNT